MNFLSEPLFQAVFNTTIPRIIIQNNAPGFTIVTCNDAQKQINFINNYTPLSCTVWEIFNIDTIYESNGLLLLTALKKAVKSKETVLTPALKITNETSSEAYRQIEVRPILSRNRKKVVYLLLTIYNAATQPAAQQAIGEDELQKQNLNTRLARLNEALAVYNEELIASNEELFRSRSQLQTLNDELEQRVQRRTQALAASEARFRNLVQYAPVAIIVLNGADMLIELANNKMLQLWNKTEAIIGKPLLEISPDMDKLPVFKLIKRVFTSGKSYTGYEIKGTVLRNGKAAEGYYDAIYQPLKDNDGAVTGLMAIITDVTDPVSARQELDRAYEQTRLARQAAQLGMFDMNLLDGTMEWDERCRMLFGIKHNQTVTYEKDFWKGLHPDDKARVKLVIDAAFNKSVSGGDYDVEYRTIGAEDKVERWVRAKGKVFFDEQDTPVRFIGSVLEITAQKQDEQRKNDFIGIVSHELKTPLTSIKAYIQLLKIKTQQQADAANAGLLSKAENQVNKMTDLIKGFLDVSRLEAGKIYIEKEDFTINTLIEEVIADVVAVTAGYPITFLPCKPVQVCADREKISQVVHNILNNAIKYSPVSSPIKVSCLLAEHITVISIQDEGIGIAKSDLNKLFDRYYRVQNPNVKMISGFGIGLYLSAEIIKLHDGKIWAESEEGNGATFFFSLPEKCTDGM